MIKDLLMQARHSLGRWCAIVSRSPAGTIATPTRSSIVDDYVARFSLGSFRYHIENKVRDCLNRIAQVEGWSKIAPGYQYLSKWESRNDVPSEYRELAQKIKLAFSARSVQLHKEKEAREEAELVSLLARQQDLIEKFYQIAERKVSTLDSYGDENWDVLPKEIDLAIKKIKGREPFSFEQEWAMERKLDQNFRAYHAQQKSVFAQDVSQLSGIEFETHIAKLLRERGYSVQGTPSTGDQGADLIVQKGGRNIVVQAKRYEGAVGNRAVQEVIGAMSYYGAGEAWVITNSTFTPQAKALAQKSNVKLFDGFELKNNPLFAA